METANKAPLVVLITRIQDADEWSGSLRFEKSKDFAWFGVAGHEFESGNRVDEQFLRRCIEREDDVWFIRGPWFDANKDNRKAFARMSWDSVRGDRGLAVRIHRGGGKGIDDEYRKDMDDVAGFLDGATDYHLGDNPTGSQAVIAFTRAADSGVGYAQALEGLREYLGAGVPLRLAPEVITSLVKHGVVGKLAAFDLDLQRWRDLKYEPGYGREMLQSGKLEGALRLLQSQVLRSAGSERLPTRGLERTIEDVVEPLAADSRVRSAWKQLRVLCGAQAEDCELYRRAVEVVKWKDAGNLDRLKKEVEIVLPGGRDPFGTWLNSLAGAFDDLKEALKQVQADRR
jgi:hypothetical protein